jgi:two-component system CheB/CheR fusion protein
VSRARAKGDRLPARPRRPTLRAGATPGSRALHDQLHAQIEDLTTTQTLLEASRDRYAALFDAAPIAYVVCDPSGRIEDLNLPAATLCGLRPAQAQGSLLRSLLAPGDRGRLDVHLRRCVEETVAVSEAVLRSRSRPGGPAVPVELRSHYIAREPFILTAILDLTASKQLEAEARRHEEAERGAREANKAKDDFIAMLSHELRTPLTPVLVAVTALQRGGLAPDKVAKLYETMTRNIQAEVHLIDDLLDVTRIVRGKIQLQPVACDVHELVREVVESHDAEARAKDLRVALELAAGERYVHGDRDRLRQVFENLVKNAIKFTPPTGRIVVSSWNKDGGVAIEVTDTGIGMEPEALSRVFRPFEQTTDGGRRGGLGLGLAICRGIVEMHGGAIAAHSRGPGKGARFVVTIATCDAPAFTPAAIVPEGVMPAFAHHGPLRVLLVDDNEDVAEALRDLLELEGFGVRVAGTAEEALSVDPVQIDLVISDLGLPGMSGHELVRQLRRKREVPAIALSGYGTEQDRRASSEAGFAVHLTKPVEAQAILSAIERVTRPPRTTHKNTESV